MAERVANDRKPSRPAPKTAEESAQIHILVLKSAIGLFLTFCWTLFCSMFTSVIIALVGVTFWWPELGAEHERQTLLIELDALAGELNQVAGSFSQWVDGLITSVMHWSWFAEGIGAVTEFFSDWFVDNAKLYGEVAYLSVLVFVVRVGVIISSLPILMLWFALGVVVGLTERDLRRINVARDQSTVFNLAMSHVKVPFVMMVMLYLSWPFAAYAIVATVPVCLGTFAMVYLTVATYKKRL